MATFTSIYQYRLVGNDDGTYSPDRFEQIDKTVTNFDDSSDIFQQKDTLFRLDGIPVGTYIGHYGDGVIYFSKDFYFLNTNDADIPASFTGIEGDFAACFLAGTRIATPGGESAIEDLAIGDLVVTSDGRTAPVRWIGVQSVVTLFADRLRTVPVRIMAGALGDGLPARDLYISPDHALMLDGVLVQAGALVDGTTISRLTNVPERFTYYHVELEDHALILAEGVPAETFVDNVTRRRFDNFAQYEALYGKADATIAEMDVPRVKSARQLPAALRERLAADQAVAAA